MHDGDVVGSVTAVEQRVGAGAGSQGNQQPGEHDANGAEQTDVDADGRVRPLGEPYEIFC